MTKPDYQYCPHRATLIEAVPELRAWEGTLGYYRRFLSEEFKNEVAHHISEWFVADPSSRVPVHELITVLEILARDTPDQRITDRWGYNPCSSASTAVNLRH